MSDLIKLQIPKEDYGVYKLPEVVVEAVSPEITQEVARRFVQQILPYSLQTGNDFLRQRQIPKWEHSIRTQRVQAVQDSINAREARGDYKDAILARKELNHLDKYGSAGCIGSVTYNYGEMLGPRFHYDSNGALYNDTSNGKSPYEFILKDVPYNSFHRFDENYNDNFRQSLLDQLRIGDIISGINGEPGTSYIPLSGHARMITGLKRDKDGHVTEIQYTEDRLGSPGPGEIVTSIWKVNNGNYADPFDHKYNNVYRIKSEEVKKLQKNKLGRHLKLRLIPKNKHF